MTNRVFINELWNDEEVGNSGLTMNDVSKFVSAEITKGIADLVKIDGSRAMMGNYNVDNLTSLATGVGIHRNSGNQLQLDQNVYSSNYISNF